MNLITARLLLMPFLNEKINAYEYQDFSCDNFIFLERGTYELTFVPNTQGSPSCSITMIEGYLGN